MRLISRLLNQTKFMGFWLEAGYSLSPCLVYTKRLSGYTFLAIRTTAPRGIETPAFGLAYLLAVLKLFHLASPIRSTPTLA